ncbi:MAG: efflux RND transporter periplasmic adaptor subunit [bacterium]
MRLLRNPVVIIFLLSGISVGTYFYIKNKSSTNMVNPIRTEQPTKQDLSQVVNASGKLKAVVQITVGSLVAGRVVKVFAQDNDIVKKGQLLAVLDDGVGDSEVKRTTADLAEACANLDFQEKFYRRQKALFSLGQISQNTFDSVTQTYKATKARVEKLNATLELNKKQYENLFVRAPEDSIVISKMVDLGQMVTAQFQATALYTLAANLHEMEAHIDIDEADIGLVKSGQAATFSVDAFPKMKFTAKVKYIRYLANIVDNVVTYDTVLDVANPDLKLRPGMTVNVDINVAGSEEAITVPNKALRIDPVHVYNAAQVLGLAIVKTENSSNSTQADISDKDYLWVMKDAKTIAQVEVKLGATDGRNTEVASGITLNDQILAEVDDVKRENLLLKGLFGKPSGGLGN